MTYNLSLMENITNPADIYIQTNNAMGGAIGISLLFILFFVVLVTFRREDFKETLLAASFTTFIFAVIFLFMGLITWQLFIYPCVLFFASIMVLFIGRSSTG